MSPGAGAPPGIVAAQGVHRVHQKSLRAPGVYHGWQFLYLIEAWLFEISPSTPNGWLVEARHERGHRNDKGALLRKARAETFHREIFAQGKRFQSIVP